MGIPEIHGLTPKVILAPMAGGTDAPFRAAVRGFGPTFVFSEMVASRELLRDRRSAVLRLKADTDTGAFGIQLAGRDVESMVEAARIAEGEGTSLIDINMGCPAKKVVGGLCGSALMREPELAVAIASAVVRAVSVPVTVKMRLGWDDASITAPSLAQSLEACGVQAVSVHGRTRCQFYEGAADWSRIADVKRAVRIPVFANGDVRTPEDARSILSVTGADGVLVGRGAFGAPWRLMQMQDAIDGRAVRAAPPAGEAWSVALGQYRHSEAHYGAELGRRIVRKHLGWYAEQLGLAREDRDALVRTNDAGPLLARLARGLSLAEAA
ncbi:MAG: tRNA dihydrouridine synthase DusB [Alphaproteobacteria bacterium]